MQLSPPHTQKADKRPIAFVLDDSTTSGKTPIVVGLTVRPEDLTRNDPSRMAVHQTLGGAWADNFGPGISSITISGHTGWRNRMANNGERDGSEAFQDLYDTVFKQWHEQRKVAIKEGHDPDLIKLIYADHLDDFAVVVAPVSFTLRRSKSRPLLFQYQIAMTVLSQNIDEAGYLQMIANARDGSTAAELSGLDSLSASIDELTNFLRDIQNYIDRTLAAPVRDFMMKTSRLYSSVMASVRAGDGIAGSLIRIANMTAAAGMNIFRTVAAVANLPAHIRARLMQVGGAYSNIFCVLSNALNQRQLYPDYNPLFGASNCSSTAGGRPLSPLSGVNPFYLYSPTTNALPVTLTDSARTNLRTVATNDPVLAPMSTTSLAASLSSIVGGMSVT